MSELPLRGVRVISIDNYFAGNYGPWLLALHGADVVKIETPARPDPVRQDPPFLDDPEAGWSHTELRFMRGKSSVLLDLRNPSGYAAFQRLVASADVFWTNLRPNSAQRLGVDEAAIRAMREDIIYASVTGFGLPTGEPAEVEPPAFDIVVQGMAGLMSRNADIDGTPCYNGVAIADQLSSIFAAFGVVMALRRRDRTGGGDCVDISMLDTVLTVNEKTLTLYSMSGEVPGPRVSATNSPFGAYPAVDGYFTIGVGSDGSWRRFCKVIGRPDLATREDLNTGLKRVAAEPTVLRPIIKDWTRNRSVAQAVAELLASDIPAGPILDVDEIIGSDIAMDRGLIKRVDLGDAGVKKLVESPIRLTHTQANDVGLVHQLGADTERVLRDWANLSAMDLATLREANAIP